MTDQRVRVLARFHRNGLLASVSHIPALWLFLAGAEPTPPAAGETAHLTVNLHARDDFEKGDLGYVTGHRVSKVTSAETRSGSNLVTALQDVKAGTDGWFEHHRSK